MTISICIFAQNEQRLLPQCIGALEAAASGESYHAHILLNGCTDDTPIVARSLAAADPRVSIHELPVGDKANAWNEYVFRIAPEASTHIFLDGDINPSVNAISTLASSLREHPDAYGAAALPVTGRSRRSWATRLFMNRYLSGNLYALTDAALARFRQHKLHLPFGAKGEDGLITYILLTDFQGGEDDSHHNRIVIGEDATFEFESLGLNWRDMKLYHRRLQRYSERHFQKVILYRLLKESGLAAMPENIFDIYSLDEIAQLRPRLHPVDFPYDVMTLKRLRASAIQPNAT
jgi:glycosyltransferase involved in cell wall biosynthesis